MRTEHKHDQRSPEWFASRCGKVTASSMSKVLAKIKSGESSERRNYRAQLVVERLTGKPLENGYTNAAMQRGIELEPEARAAYESEKGIVVLESGFWALDEIDVGASPDGLIGSEGILEIKCPNLATHIQYIKESRLPPEYEPQIMTQLWVTGRKWCDFISYAPEFPETLRMFSFRIHRNENRIRDINEECVRFLAEVFEEVSLLSTGQFGMKKTVPPNDEAMRNAAKDER